MMPDLKPELYFGSATTTIPVENPPDSTPNGMGAAPKILPNFTTVPGGYTGPATITYYNPAATLDVTVTPAGTLEYSASLTIPTGAVKSITIPGQPKPYLIGRDAPDGAIPIVLNLDAGGDLKFRPEDTDHNIPIGSYAEFQLINSNLGTMDQGYKQEANLDLMDIEWTPIGAPAAAFNGVYDGNGHTLTNLKIDNPTSGAAVGLFGYLNGGTIKNLGIASGSVQGNDPANGKYWKTGTAGGGQLPKLWFE